ncbi:MAG: hypothetical protein Q7Q71_07950 [Verrucomicrobiota bacterium JB023]|nr:hypothetical protein [Verrucomicrobiota bacterium JB023]
MRTFLNFFLAILLFLAFAGSAFFFVSTSNHLEFQRVNDEPPADEETAGSE